MKKIKKWFASKTARMAAALSAAAACLCMAASAAEPGAGETASNSDQVISAMSTGFSGVAADLGKVILAIVPIALGIVGLTVLIKRGMAWFKSMSKG